MKKAFLVLLSSVVLSSLSLVAHAGCETVVSKDSPGLFEVHCKNSDGKEYRVGENQTYTQTEAADVLAKANRDLSRFEERKAEKAATATSEAKAQAKRAAHQQRILNERKAVEDAIIAKNDPARIAQSVQNCQTFADNRKYIPVEGLGIAIGGVLGNFAGVAMSSAAANGDEAPALTMSSAGTTVVGLDIDGAQMVSEAVQIFMSVRDFPKLAYELGNDQEGLVSKSYMDSCKESAEGQCHGSLVLLKRQAKLGTMCKDWVVSQSFDTSKDDSEN